MKNVSFEVDKKLFKKFKKFCVDREFTIKDALTTAMKILIKYNVLSTDDIKSSSKKMKELKQNGKPKRRKKSKTRTKI